MPTSLRDIPKTKLILAACGVLTLLAMAAGGVIVAVSGTPPHVSELALHPEQQDEILARREAEQLQKEIGLSEDQTKDVAALWLKYRQQIKTAQTTVSSGPMQMVGRMQARMQLTADIRKLLTPEQQKAFDDTPDGQRQNVIQMMQNSTSEQRQAFFNQMRERIPKGLFEGAPGGDPRDTPGTVPNGN